MSCEAEARGQPAAPAKGRAAAGRLLVAPDRGREKVVLAEAFRRAGRQDSQRQLANIAKTIDATMGTPATGRLNFSAVVDAHPDLVAVRGEGGLRVLAWREQPSGQDRRALVETLASRLAASGRTSLAVASLKRLGPRGDGSSFDETAYGCRSMAEFLRGYPDISQIEPSVGPAGALAVLVQAPAPEQRRSSANCRHWPGR